MQRRNFEDFGRSALRKIVAHFTERILRRAGEKNQALVRVEFNTRYLTRVTLIEALDLAQTGLGR